MTSEGKRRLKIPQPDWGPLEIACAAIQNNGLWEDCRKTALVGRCWGKRGKNTQSTLPGSHIVLSDGIVIVLIHTEGNGNDRHARLKITVAKIDASKQSDLEARVKALLQEHDLPICA